jgi:hypothetical protein
MPKQRGVFKVSGTIDDVTFMETKDGFFVKQKSSVTAEQILNSPAFERTRENMAEFSRAGKASRLFNQAFTGSVVGIADNRLVSRITKQMVRVIKADAVNERGKRNVIDGESELLKGFPFNGNTPFGQTFKGVYSTNIDRANGTVKATVDAFVPKQMVKYPAGATHFRISSTAARINFEDEIFELDTDTTAWQPIDNLPTVQFNLAMAVKPASTEPIFLGIGIDFTQEVNGIRYALNDRSLNAFDIAAVDGN